MGERREDDAHDDEHNEVTQREPIPRVRQLPERQRQQEESVEAGLRERDGGRRDTPRQILDQEHERAVGEAGAEAGGEAGGGCPGVVAEEPRREDHDETGERQRERRQNDGLAPQAEDARRRQRHPHGHHEEQDHGDGHAGGADGDEEEQGRDGRHGAMSRSRGAAPGRRQSRSMPRRAKNAARTRNAKAIRTQSTTLVGASVRPTSDAAPPMSRYAATTIA